MTLTGNPKEPEYVPGSVPGVDIPQPDDDDALGSIDNEPLGKLDSGGPLGSLDAPSVASTRIPKPDLGIVSYTTKPLYFDEAGNYVEINPTPSGRDYSQEITAALNRLQQQTSIIGVSNSFTNSVASLMAIPEFVSMINELNTDEVIEIGDEAGTSMTGKAILGELAADVGIQVLTAMRNADVNRLLSSTSYSSTDEEMIASQNVIALFDEVGSEMEPWMRQNAVSMLASLPAHLFTQPNPVVGGMVFGASNLLSAVTGKQSKTYEEFAEDASTPRFGRNFREEVAASALVRWREQPPRTQAEKEAWIAWMYSFSQQKLLEARAIEGHLGSLAYSLDLPRQGVTNRINDVINRIAFPNDTLDRSHLPAGENIAFALGISSQDVSPSWIFDSPVGKIAEASIDNLVSVATPITFGISAYNVARGGEALRTPFISEFWDEFSETNSFQLLAGGFQLSTFFWADPINYAAGIGLGYKATRTVPRFNGVTRALQLRRAATPLRGAGLTGVRGGMSARITHAMMSQSVTEMVAAGRAGSRQGNKLVRAFVESESTSSIIRKVPQLDGNRLVVPLKRLVDKGDINGFWDLIELSMSGANEASSPFLFQSIKSKAHLALTELHSATKKALEDGNLGVRDVMTGLYGMHPNSTLYQLADDGPRTVIRAIDDAAGIVAPGANRTAINQRLGWVVDDVLDDRVIRRIREVDEELANALAHVKQRQALQASVAILPDEMATRLERVLDDVLEADAIQIGDDILVKSSSEYKLMTGLDITTPEGSLTTILPEQTASAVQGTIIADLLEGSQRTVMLIDQMPRPRLAANFWEKAGKWAGANSRTSVARFGRRLSASAKFVSPGDIDPSKTREGLHNLLKRMKIHGASRLYTDRVESAWLEAVTNEDRYVIATQALRGLGDDVGVPALFSAYGDHIARFGETGYGKRTVGASFEEIGAAKSADGTLYISPTIVEHHQRVLQLGDAYVIEKEAARYRRAGKLPRGVVVGWGKTKKRREAIAVAYRKQIIDERGPEAWLALGTSEAGRKDVALSMAFADMTDRTNRGVGLGKVNAVFSSLNRVHKGFHTTFTLAQLAGRPFAWASRVLMEEHIRGWLAGLPTLIANPTAYLANTWNAGMVSRVDGIMARQLKQAESSAKLLFGGAMPMDEALRVADEIIPGWSAKIAKSGINLGDAGQVRAQWTSMLARALGDNKILTSSSRAGITRRVLFKQESLNRIVKRHNEWFGFDPRIFNWNDDVPELTGASILRQFSNELEGSIGEMRFTPNMKAKTRAAVAHAHATKAQQVMSGVAGRVAIGRMLQKLRGEAVTFTGERFARTRVWADMRRNIEDVARARGVIGKSDAELAEWYLDVIMRQDWIEGNFKYLWGDSPGEKIRVLDEIVTSRTATVRVGGKEHTVTMRPSKYAEGKNAWAALFDDLDSAGRHEEVLPVMGVLNAYFAQESVDISKIKKITNWILQTFGENASQNLHRRPAYLAERKRYLNIYKQLGWEADDAAQIAGEKAFETVNWLFFNNHHTGELLRRMNSTIPFFSAWAEVMSTWAWKIPSLNVLGVGHAVMIHKIDSIMQGFARMGIVSIDDSGQWRMNFDDESAALSPAGRGLSAMGHSMIQTPVAAIMQGANIGRWLKSQLSDEEYEALELSDWSKDNYSIAIGSPVQLNSTGVMGVNQFAFGFTPAYSYGSDILVDLFSWAGNKVAERLQIGGDTATIIAPTLAEAYDQMPETVSQSEFLSLNREVIIGRIGLDGFDALFKGGVEFFPPENVDLSGLMLQMPGSSFFDKVVDPVLYPFGHIEGLDGVVRAVVPSSASYILRSVLGMYADGSAFGEGIVNFLTGPLQQYQVDGEVHAAQMLLEATEGTYTKINAISNELNALYKELGAESPEDIASIIVAGSPEAKKVAELQEALQHANDTAAKRTTDMAFHATMGRGIMGLFGPATPRTQYADQRYKSEFYATKEIAEILNERGDFDWTPLWESGSIKSKEDFMRANIEIEKWYNDPSGGEVKAFIKENYPSLLAWITPTTFWGPAGSPPLGRDMDITMEGIVGGSKQRLPDDVTIQKYWRNTVEAQYESDIIVNSGTNDQVEQARWALTNPDIYRSIKDQKRNSLKSLDWFDDLYNNGNYRTYRDSVDDSASLFEEWEESLFAMTDATDDLMTMVAHAGIANNEEQDRIAGIVNASLGRYWDARREALDNMGVERKFWSRRDEFLYEYEEQVTRPLRDDIDEAFRVVDEAESAAERSVGFEMVREAENTHYDQQHFVVFDGSEYRVPSELQRRWDETSEEDRIEQVREWTGTNVKYLSEFAIDRMVEREEGFRRYLPWEQQPQRIISNATQEKAALLDEIRVDYRKWTSYEKTIALENIEATMQNNLVTAGYSGVVQYMEAWPMERLVITGTLPAELGLVAGWFIGMRNDLESIEKSPTSDAGKDMFLEFGNMLDIHFNQFPDQEAMFKEVGSAMFGEDANWALYYRFAGVRFGDAGQ